MSNLKVMVYWYFRDDLPEGILCRIGRESASRFTFRDCNLRKNDPEIVVSTDREWRLRKYRDAVQATIRILDECERKADTLLKEEENKAREET